MGKKAVLGAALVVVVAIMMLLAMMPPSEDDGGEVSLDRNQAIPETSQKMTPQTDLMPPVLHDDSWLTPVPMEGPVNTAGLEDSPFISEGGDEFYFFFTPAWGVPPEEQVYDGFTGIWRCQLVEGQWTEPVLLDLGEISLDGATFLRGDEMWFASVRAGNYGEIDIYTTTVDEWIVENAGEYLNSVLDIGEFHISPDGTMYFGRDSEAGDRDLYSMEWDGGWGIPEPLNLNTDLNEDMPFITQDGEELWFTGTSRLGYTGPAIFRSLWNGTGWGEPQEIISQFAGEPCLDAQGNIYFVHHYLDGDIIEADIYVAMIA